MLLFLIYMFCSFDREVSPLHLHFCTFMCTIHCIVPISPDMEDFHDKILFLFISISLNMCFGCSKEPSH